MRDFEKAISEIWMKDLLDPELDKNEGLNLIESFRKIVENNDSIFYEDHLYFQNIIIDGVKYESYETTIVGRFKVNDTCYLEDSTGQLFNITAILDNLEKLIKEL